MTKNKFKNLPLDSTFQLGNVKLKVAEDIGDNGCRGCFIADTDLECSELKGIGAIPECCGGFREDGKEVVFKED